MVQSDNATGPYLEVRRPEPLQLRRVHPALPVLVRARQIAERGRAGVELRVPEGQPIRAHSALISASLAAATASSSCRLAPISRLTVRASPPSASSPSVSGTTSSSSSATSCGGFVGSAAVSAAAVPPPFLDLPGPETAVFAG